MKAYASFAEWRDDQSVAHQKLIKALSTVVKQCAPHFNQSVKWGQGCWLDQNDPRVFIHAEPDHLQLGFYSGSTLDDPERLLVGKGKHVRYVKIYASKRLPRQALSRLIAQVV